MFKVRGDDDYFVEQRESALGDADPGGEPGGGHFQRDRTAEFT